MRSTFKIIDQEGKHVGTVVIVPEEQVNGNIGLIFSQDLSKRDFWLYEQADATQIINDLTERVGINYEEFVEV